MHSFSIASILGEDKPAKKISNKRKKDDDLPKVDQAMGFNPQFHVPLLTSTPLPISGLKQDLSHSTTDISLAYGKQEYPSICQKREDSKYTTPIMDNEGRAKETMLPPPIESSARVEKWVLENCVSHNNVSPETNRRDILAESFALAMGESTHTVGEQSENGEDKSASSGSHDRSFTSESYSRPGSPDYDQSRPSKKARTSFSASQLCDLETKYRTQRYISAADRIKVARKLRLSDQQVKTWYQNRRMKEKRQVQDMEHARKFNAIAQGMAALQNPSTFIFGHSKLPGSSAPVPVPFSQAPPVTTLPQPGSIDFLNQQMHIGQQIMATPPVVGSFTAMLASQSPLVSPHGVGPPMSQSLSTLKEPVGGLNTSPSTSFSPPSSLTHVYPPQVSFTSGQMSSAFTRVAPSGISTAFTPSIGYPAMHPFSQSVM